MDRKNKNDLLPRELVKFRTIEEAFFKRCRSFGYEEIKSATVEPLYIFTATDALTPELLKKVYSFLDWKGYSGERVVLRPDCTISTIRYYLDNLVHKEHAKLSYAENHFFVSDESDDVSERWQFGIENIGDESIASDIETLFIALDTVKAVGFQSPYLNLSYPAIIIECVKLAFPHEEADRKAVFDLIKTNRLDDIKHVSHRTHTLTTLYRLLHFKGTSASYLTNLKSDFNQSEIIQRHLNRFRSICLALDGLNFSYEINFALSKNFDYYSGMQFEIHSVARKRTRREVICSGGRYDNLITTLSGEGKKIPSVGCAFYVKNMLNFIHTPEDHLQHVVIIVKSVNSRNINTGQCLCSKLESLGFICRISLREIKEQEYETHGLVIDVDHEKYKDGYTVLHSQQIGKPLLKNIFT
jgi:histidyl-tRNA synthetase